MSTVTPYRCYQCRRGVMASTALLFRCPLCGSGQWVAADRLSLMDRYRLWRFAGVVPWATLVPDPEVFL